MVRCSEKWRDSYGCDGHSSDVVVICWKDGQRAMADRGW